MPATATTAAASASGVAVSRSDMHAMPAQVRTVPMSGKIFVRPVRDIKRPVTMAAAIIAAVKGISMKPGIPRRQAVDQLQIERNEDDGAENADRGQEVDHNTDVAFMLDSRCERASYFLGASPLERRRLDWLFAALKLVDLG